MNVDVQLLKKNNQIYAKGPYFQTIKEKLLWKQNLEGAKQKAFERESKLTGMKKIEDASTYLRMSQEEKRFCLRQVCNSKNIFYNKFVFLKNLH